MSTADILRYTTFVLVILAIIAMVVEKQYDFHAKKDRRVDKSRALSLANLWGNISSTLFTISGIVGLLSYLK